MIVRERTRLAAYAVCADDGRILLCRIAGHVVEGERWILPGGGVDFGEDPAAAVIRELAEECGLRGTVERLLDVHSRLFDHADGPDPERLHAVRILYRVRVVGGALRDETDGSTDTCAWFTPAAARALDLTEVARRGLALFERGP